MARRRFGRRFPAADGLAASGLAAVGGGVAWYAALMRPILAAQAYGPICSHSGALGLHCAGCYEALAMAGAGLALMASASLARRAPASLRSR